MIIDIMHTTDDGSRWVAPMWLSSQLFELDIKCLGGETMFVAIVSLDVQPQSNVPCHTLLARAKHHLDPHGSCP